MTKRCKKCGSPDIPAYLAAKSDYRCAPCHSARAKAYRDSRPAKPRSAARIEALRDYDRTRFKARYLDPIERQKHQARNLARHAVYAGRLTRGPCEVCGSSPTEAHHDDYGQPLSVRWLCPTHHRDHHAAERAASRA